jgi:hypothetical protein
VLCDALVVDVCRVLRSCCGYVFIGDRFVVLCVTSGGCVCHRMMSKMMLDFVVVFSFSWLLAMVSLWM